MVCILYQDWGRSTGADEVENRCTVCGCSQSPLPSFHSEESLSRFELNEFATYGGYQLHDDGRFLGVMVGEARVPLPNAPFAERRRARF